ncbi:MAG: oxidoreductase [Parvularculaceae bacterium]|nr:SDR family NAD(P)-dependent oxidoreductase [Caulobacterales bacterium]
MTVTRQFGPSGWTPDRVPDLKGKTFLITGGNSGIGREAARILGACGARVIILCRSKGKASVALAELAAVAPRGTFESIALDLADLSSVRLAAKQARERVSGIDGLINNAGIMMVPKRELTADGFEMQFGVNHLGHFAFAGLLCDLVEKAGGRFVAVSSLMHRYAPRIRVDDLNYEHGYTPTAAYAHSKLANLVYALELNRRLAASGCKARSFACHPGYSNTNLQSTGPSQIMALAMKPLTALLSQSAAKGAIPTVLCASSPEADAGGYYGPTGFRDMKGPVDRSEIGPQALDGTAARKLWEASEKLTGVTWSILTRN